MNIWYKQQCFNITFETCKGFSDETSLEIECLNKITPDLNDIFIAINNNNPEIMIEVTSFLVALRIRGMLTLLGMRKTIGSQDCMYPELHLLKASFNKPHTILSPEELIRVKFKQSLLTTGARALTKHSHRSSDRFWGNCTGKEAYKNEMASQVLDNLIQNCIWMNIHILPHQEAIIEIRVQEGYGARWTIAGDFRGFLEPQMEGGHDLKWRH